MKRKKWSCVLQLGRAAKKMAETTGENASTLHRLLCITKINDTKFINEDIQIEPIDADVIIVDEVSMIDLSLMKYLLMGVYEGTKLVLVRRCRPASFSWSSEVS